MEGESCEDEDLRSVKRALELDLDRAQSEELELEEEEDTPDA